MLSAGRTVRPGVPEVTRNWARPSSVVAVTSNRSACPPASTGAVVPSRTNTSPRRLARTPADGPPARAENSGGLQAATVSPPTRPARCWLWLDPPARDRAPATTLVGTSGPGDTNWPTSSATRPRSASPPPETEPPPCSSATSMETHPSSAPRRHHARSNPPGCSSAIRRTTSSGQVSSRNLRVVSWNSCWSSVSPNCTVNALPCLSMSCSGTKGPVAPVSPSRRWPVVGPSPTDATDVS